MLIRGRRRARTDVADDLDEFFEADVSVTWKKKIVNEGPRQNRNMNEQAVG